MAGRHIESRFGYISTSDCLKLCDDTMMCGNATKQNNTQDLHQDCFTASFPVQWMFAAVLVDRGRPQPFCLSIQSHRYTQTHSVLTAIFQVNLIAPLILLLHIFLDCASLLHRPKLSMSFLTQSHQVFFRASSWSNSFNFPRCTPFDSVGRSRNR